MSINGMNVGKDYSLAYYDSDSGDIVSLGDVQNFKFTAQKHDIKSMPYNDDPRFGFIPDGYKFTFTITRTTSELEDFQLAANERFAAGLSSKSGILNETVNNADNTTSRYQYTGFVFWLNEIGDVSREKTVTMTAEGFASRKKKIS